MSKNIQLKPLEVFKIERTTRTSANLLIIQLNTISLFHYKISLESSLLLKANGIFFYDQVEVIKSCLKYFERIS